MKRYLQFIAGHKSWKKIKSLFRNLNLSILGDMLEEICDTQFLEILIDWEELKLRYPLSSQVLWQLPTTSYNKGYMAHWSDHVAAKLDEPARPWDT